MSDDIKKYKKLVESSFTTEASDTDGEIVDHMGKLIVDLVKDGLIKGDHTSEDLRELVRGLQQDHSNETIEKILDKAHEISKHPGMG
jgi:polyhydroxyalkanoate synthesis regulator phasin